MTNRPIIALDFETLPQVNQFLDQFNTESLFVKVGMELFYQNGPEIVTRLKQLGHSVFF